MPGLLDDAAVPLAARRLVDDLRPAGDDGVRQAAALDDSEAVAAAAAAVAAEAATAVGVFSDRS